MLDCLGLCYTYTFHHMTNDFKNFNQIVFIQTLYIYKAFYKGSSLLPIFQPDFSKSFTCTFVHLTFLWILSEFTFTLVCVGLPRWC